MYVDAKEGSQWWQRRVSFGRKGESARTPVNKEETSLPTTLYNSDDGSAESRRSRRSRGKTSSFAGRHSASRKCRRSRRSGRCRRCCCCCLRKSISPDMPTRLTAAAAGLRPWHVAVFAYRICVAFVVNNKRFSRPCERENVCGEVRKVQIRRAQEEALWQALCGGLPARHHASLNHCL
jgi:hypothetical protein